MGPRSPKTQGGDGEAPNQSGLISAALLDITVKVPMAVAPDHPFRVVWSGPPVGVTLGRPTIEVATERLPRQLRAIDPELFGPPLGLAGDVGIEAEREHRHTFALRRNTYRIHRAHSVGHARAHAWT